MILFASIISVVDERVKVRLIDQPLNLIFDQKDQRITLFSKTYEGHYKIALKTYGKVNNPI